MLMYLYGSTILSTLEIVFKMYLKIGITTYNFAYVKYLLL